ncbi:MAG: CoA transferase [Chloroflexi bacterium]|nr:CoA transferase [Chloroflexota bacterium]
MAGVLEGVKVIAMGLWWAVPYAGSYMADWGADVIKVEPLTGEFSRGTQRVSGGQTRIKIGDAEVDPIFQFLNRNQRSLALDLKKEAGRDILYQLVKASDVFMSNHQLASLERLKLDYASLRRINPRLIYAVLTGYGSKGPDRDEAALDMVVGWARSGMQHLATEPGAPPTQAPDNMGDFNAATHLTAGIAAALFHREKTGEGQAIELSLLHSAFWSISARVQRALVGQPLAIGDPANRRKNPLHINYQAQDGRWLAFAMTQSDLYWPAFCRAIARPELENDPRFNSMEKRTQNCEELIAILDKVFAAKPIDEWDEICRQHHLLYSRVKTVEEAVTDPQALANDFFVDLRHPAGPLKVLSSPIKFGQNPASVRGPAPELGQHNEEILLDLGYGWEDIARLKEQKVIL